MKGTSGIGKGKCAIVECATVDTDEEEQNKSELFVSLTKIVGGFTDEFVSRRKFFFADVEAIVRPIAVVPNFGAENNKHSLIKERETWRNDFVSWLEARPSEQEIEAEKHAYTFLQMNHKILAQTLKKVARKMKP